MSFIDSESMQTLFLDSFPNSLFLPTDLSDNINDISIDSKKEKPTKKLKFVLTKEELPTINFLQKKILPKINESKNTKNNPNGGRWNKDEQKRFAEAVLKYGNDWKKIQNHIFSRNITQVRSHAQKFLMKLKENNLFQNKCVVHSMSWTKVINYLRTILSYDELKNLLFSVEQGDEKKNEKKKYKKNKISMKKSEENEFSPDFSRFNSIYVSNIENGHFFFENEEEILKKYIECFNSPSGEINLNTSFEEESSSKENENDSEYKFLNNVK